MQVYVHHYFSAADLVSAEGAELRGTMSEEPLPAPYFTLGNGSAFQSAESRCAMLLAYFRTDKAL